MKLNEVDIYSCRFFTLNEDKQLQFCGGVHKGKTAEDFTTAKELQRITAYCFWIINKEDIPIASKYAASYFLKSLTPKFLSLERGAKKKAIDKQRRLKQETEELTKTTGKKYI
jgi:hypothetical protein